MLPSPYDVHYFLEVASTSNMSRAAERLGIQQSSLSQAIKRLEDSIGSPLFLRTNAGMKMTKAGLLFQAQARELYEKWEGLQKRIRQSETELAGAYSIGCHPSIGIHALPLILPKLLKENPTLEIRLHHESSRGVMDAVVDFRLDFGLVVGAVRHPDLVVRPLVEADVTVWARKDVLDAWHSKKEDPVFIYMPDTANCDWILKEMKKKHIRFSREIHSSNLEVIAHLVASGTGMGVLPEWYQRFLTTQKATRVSGMPCLRDTVSLIYRFDTQKSAAARKMIKALEHHARW